MGKIEMDGWTDIQFKTREAHSSFPTRGSTPRDDMIFGRRPRVFNVE